MQLGTTPASRNNVPGYVRGYDVRTGKLLWTFHTIAQPGDFGNETWENGSWKYTGNTAVWAPMSADPELGYVYLPVETPTGDFYGGHRPGDDLFDESLVCVDARTGQRVWHFQIIHHGIWDWDNPAAPVLLDITVNGKKIKSRRAGDQASLCVCFRSRDRQSRCGPLKNGRCPNPTFLAKRPRPRNRSQPSRRPSIAKA